MICISKGRQIKLINKSQARHSHFELFYRCSQGTPINDSKYKQCSKTTKKDSIDPKKKKFARLKYIKYIYTINSQ